MAAKREPSTRSVMTMSPPPTYSPGSDERPRHAQYPSLASSSTGGGGEINPYDPFATTTGHSPNPSDDTGADRKSPPPQSMTATSTDNTSVAHFSMAASIAGSDGRYDITGSDRGGERNITNYINIARKATPHHRIFSLFYPNPKITDTFYIDPHLKVPGAVLNSIKSSIRTPHVPTTRRGELRAERREQQQDLPKNLTLSLEDGRMDVNIHLIADCDPNSSFTRRLRSKASLSSQSALGSLRKPVVPRTTITASVNATRPKTFKAYPMLIRIFAPQPRPPFFFQATCTGSTSISRSPLTLFIPISFHGPITIKIRVGNIDNHLWMSPAVAGVARMMSEDEQSRGYFLGALPDTLDEEDEDSDDAAVSTRPIISADRDDDEESWQGDKIDIDIGNGRLRILFEDDRLEGTLRGASSNGWIWPAKWG